MKCEKGVSSGTVRRGGVSHTQPTWHPVLVSTSARFYKSSFFPYFLCGMEKEDC